MNCSGGFCHGVPDYVLVWPHGGVTVFPVGNNQIQGLTCSAVDSGRALSLPISEGQEKMYSTILAAITAKKSLTIRLPDSDETCIIQYIKFSEDV